jgi:hypothetical protein
LATVSDLRVFFAAVDKRPVDVVVGDVLALMGCDLSDSVSKIRAEDVKVGDVEKHVSGQGRETPWRRVAAIGQGYVKERLTLTYESGDRLSDRRD